MSEHRAPLWSDEVDGAEPSPAIRKATISQREAANPQETVWVAASAGTGKTRVLTNRFLALLLDGAQPSQILALTFTKAAAAEMADRVSEALEEWVTLSDAALERALFKLAGERPVPDQLALARRLFARVLEAPGGLNIQTIHAFSQSLLGRFPIEAGIQPGFRVLEDSEASALLDTSLDRFLVGLASLDNPPVVQVFEAMGEEALRAIIAGLIRERGRLKRLRSSGPPAAASAAASDSVSDSDPDSASASASASAAGKRSVDAITAPLAALIDHVEGQSIAALEAAISNDGDLAAPVQAALRAFGEWVESTGKARNQNNGPLLDAIAWMALPDRERRAARWRAYRDLFFKASGEPRNLPRSMTKAFVNAHSVALETLEQEQRRVVALDAAIKACRQIEVSRALLETAYTVLDDYERAKAAISRVDFDDLILTTIDLLTSEAGAGLWVAFKLDQGLAHVLVDEAQDTNPDQWAIIRGLTQAFYDGTDEHRDGVRTSFVVGDLKQSIYGFQRADPQVFQAMRDTFGADVQRADGNWDPKDLNVTFRSAQPILDAVNLVFSEPETARGLTFDDETFPLHESGRETAGGLVEVWSQIEPKPKKNANGNADSDSDGKRDADANGPETENETENKPPKLVRDDDDLDDEDRPEVELARVLGQRIAAWTNGTAQPGDEGWLENHARPMRASDIMVLVRSRSGPFIATLTQTLKQHRVAVAGADRMKLTEQLVVQDLIVLVEYLLQPGDDLALATLLRSPFVGFSEGQLYDLARHRPEGETLDTALAKAARAGQAEAVAAQSFFTALRGQMASAPYAFLTHLLSRMDGAVRVSERLGPQAADAIKELLRAALTYERANTPTLPGFLGWLRQADIQVKREQDAESAGVRIMTVHGSKGLESPVVILPHSQRRTDDISRDRLRWYDDGETPIPYWKPRTEQTPEAITALELKDKQRAQEEERRLLYVAMTRAEERLYICGWKTRKSGGSKDGAEARDAALTWYDTVVEGLTDKPGVLRLEPPAGAVAQPVLRIAKTATKPDRVSPAPEPAPEPAPTPALEPVPAPEPAPALESAAQSDPAGVDPALLDRLRAPIPPEPSPPRPFAPSQMLEEPASPSPLSALQTLRGQGPAARGARSASPFFRGNVLHALLQHLPQVPAEQRQDAALRYLRRASLGLSEPQIADWSAEVLAITNGADFSPLFAEGSRAEVALSGLVGQFVVSGQIDRLVVRDADVWIVDYKSNRPPPSHPDQVPVSYRAQLAAYQAVLEGLYPAKAIRTFLLWTETPRLMEVPVSRADLPPLAQLDRSD